MRTHRTSRRLTNRTDVTGPAATGIHPNCIRSPRDTASRLPRVAGESPSSIATAWTLVLGRRAKGKSRTASIYPWRDALTRWCSPRSCSAGASRSIRLLRPGHRHVQRPGGMSWRARRSRSQPRASRVLGRRSILWRKGDQPRALPAPNCAHEARCAPSAARGEPARQSFVRPNQRIGEAAPTCAHLRPGGALRTSSCRNVSRRGVTLPRENAADRGRWSSSSQPRIAAAASSKI